MQEGLSTLIATEESIGDLRDWILQRVEYWDSNIAPAITRIMRTPMMEFTNYLSCLYLVNDLVFHPDPTVQRTFRGDSLFSVTKDVLSFSLTDHITPVQHSQLSFLLNLWKEHKVWSATDLEKLQECMSNVMFNEEEMLMSFSVGKMAEICKLESGNNSLISWSKYHNVQQLHSSSSDIEDALQQFEKQ